MEGKKELPVSSNLAMYLGTLHEVSRLESNFLWFMPLLSRIITLHSGITAPPSAFLILPQRQVCWLISSYLCISQISIYFFVISLHYDCITCIQIFLCYYLLCVTQIFSCVPFFLMFVSLTILSLITFLIVTLGFKINLLI